MIERWTPKLSGPGFNPHKRHCVVTLKRWVRPDMTEKLLTGMLSLNTNKQTHCYILIVFPRSTMSSIFLWKILVSSANLNGGPASI